MKTRKLLSLILALAMIFSAVPMAFAADISSIEEDIIFIKENSTVQTPYIEHVINIVIEAKLEKFKADPEAHQEDIDAVAAETADYRAGLEKCLAGEHTLGYIADTSYPGPCTSTEFCYYCDYSGKHISNSIYVEHNDYDKDDICNSCGKELQYVNCDHFCHNNNWFISNIILPIALRIWDYFGINEFCECGLYHLYSKNYH